MKRMASLFLLIAMFCIATPSFARMDICKMGEKALTMTSAQMKDFFEDRINGRRVEGSGKVEGVLAGNNVYFCKIIVRCGNDVFITIHVGECSERIRDLKIGQKIRFNATCRDVLGRRYYRDSDKTYIKVLVADPLLQY